MTEFGDGAAGASGTVDASHAPAAASTGDRIRVIGAAPAWTSWFGLVVGFLSAQRFSLPYVSPYVCLVPLLLAVLAWERPPLRNLFVAIALLGRVDSSDIAYVDTLNVVRLAIYATAFAVVMAEFRIAMRRLVLFAAYVTMLLGMSLANQFQVDAYSLGRDAITLALTFALLGVGRDTRIPVLNIPPLVWFSFGLLSAEVLNILFFYHSESAHYLSYDSLKCIVVFASLYALVNGRLLLFTVLCGSALLVLMDYATRMLLVTYVVSIVLVAFSRGIARSGRVAAFGFVAVAVLVVSVALSQEFIESSRVFSFIYVFTGTGNWLEYVRVLDPVRFTEHEMFFSRPWFNLVFGSGLGSGFIDGTGLLSFVESGTGAFSDRELLESRFFRLHDAWIYFGLRLGLVFVVFAYGLFIRAMLSSSRDKMLLGCLGLLMLNTATFSIAGLFMTALVGKQLLMGEARSRAASALQ
jgi:hypothetical protein